MLPSRVVSMSGIVTQVIVMRAGFLECRNMVSHTNNAPKSSANDEKVDS